MWGTASTVRAFLLLENAGPWGVHALHDARLPDGLGEELVRRAAANRVRVLLVRRPGRQVASSRISVLAAYAHHSEPWLESTELGDIHEVHDLDLEALGAGRSMGLSPHPEPVFAVCTHGRHDTCCAERGRPVAAGLAAVHPDSTWEVSHIGGDRFAANLLVLPHGLYYGRLEPAAAVGVADAHLDGRMDLEHLRGRSGLAMSLQAAEVELRRFLKEERLGAVRYLSRRVEGSLDAPSGHATEAVFEVDFEGGPQRFVVGVTSRHGEEAWRLTCKAAHDDRIPQHEVNEIRRVS